MNGAQSKWRIQREWFAPYDYLFEPAFLVWAAYPPAARNRKPYLFASWGAAMRFVGIQLS